MDTTTYDQILEQYRELNKVGATVDDDRRSNPRLLVAQPPFRPKTGFVQVRHEHKYQLVDISLGGVAFNSNFIFKPGSHITIALDNRLEISAEVLTWRVFERSTEVGAMNFRVHCKFRGGLNPEDFLIALILAEDPDIDIIM